MVKESQFWFDTYYEEGHSNHELICGTDYEKNKWRSETGKLKRFINAYTKDDNEKRGA